MIEALSRVTQINTRFHTGYVLGSEGLMLVVSLPGAFVGELCTIEQDMSKSGKVLAEVIAIDQQQAKLMPFKPIQGIRYGDTVHGSGEVVTQPVGVDLLGHVLNAFGEPLGERPLYSGERSPVGLDDHINPLHRLPIKQRLNTKIKALDSFIPLGKGQRVGVMAGSGVGKSTLLSLLCESLATENTLVVIVLVGERGREVEEFANHQLTQEMKKRTVLIAATAEEMPVTRVLAAKYGLAVAESLSHTGKDVVLMMDSITRVAIAQREIGLAIGEPSTAKGYTPSVFSLLQRIVERCGSFQTRGAITALFTILVETDDFDDPIVDSLRASLDGHIVLDRKLAAKGHYPAIDILASISRLTSSLLDEQRQQLAIAGRNLLADFEQKKMMIDLAEAEGTLAEKYRALRARHHDLCEWLQQGSLALSKPELLLAELTDIVAMEPE